jgi:pyruvate kinase
LAEGLNTIVITAKDAAGNIKSSTAKIILDTQGPIITFTKPTNNATVDINSGSMVIINVADAGSGVDLATASVTMDGTNVTTEIKKVGNTIYYFLKSPLAGGTSITVDGTPAVTHKVVVTINDNLGNSTTRTLSFTVKNYRRGFGFGRFQF